MTTTGTVVAPVPGPRRPGAGRRRRSSVTAGQGLAGWLFVAPVVIVLGLFFLAPILMAAWVAVSDWRGQGSPLSGRTEFVGGDNFTALVAEPGLARTNFMTSIRNNAYFVLLVVPLQTVLALVLAVALNQQRLKGKGFFRTAYFFPSVTSSVAISVVFLFVFSSSGVVNAVLGTVGIDGPQWFADPRGILHLLLDAVGIDAFGAGSDVLGLSGWEWLAGPSVAMCAIIALVVWTTSGTFMLMFLAALQDIPVELDEAAEIDGATRWQRFRFVTLPMLRPVLFLVLTLGLIGTWHVFDQIYIMSQGSPGKTTLTPAYLSYESSFRSNEWGQGSAIAFLVFLLIIVLTLGQRWLLRERDVPKRKRFARASSRGEAGS